MKHPFKPAGYNSVSPYFIIPDAEKFIGLIQHIFDAFELRRYNRPDGSVMHAEFRIDDSVIMIGEASDEYPSVPIVMHVYVPDVDNIFEKAVATGCEVVEKPKQNENDPDRRGTFRDYAGNLWSIGTQLQVQN